MRMLRCLALVLLCLLLPACLPPASGWEEVPVGFIPLAEATDPEITLDEATLTLGNLRLLAPTLAKHPGHGEPVEVTGELATTTTVDLLGSEQSLGHATVLPGTFAGASLELLPDAETGLVLSLAGTVGQRPLDIEITDPLLVDSLLFSDSLSPGDSLLLSFDIGLALSATRWEEIEDQDEDGVLTETDGSLPRSIPFGLRSVAAWNLAVAP